MKEKRTLDVTSELATAIKDFGFPIVAAMGLGYFVYYVWKWVTTEIKPVATTPTSKVPTVPAPLTAIEDTV